MVRTLLPTAIILLFCGAYSAIHGMHNDTKLPLPEQYNPQVATTDHSPGSGVGGSVANANSPAPPIPNQGAAGDNAPCGNANCDCDNCTCGGACTCGQVQYQNITVNETYNEQVCDGQTCRLVPRVRQVVRRVAVGTAARAANVVRAAVTPPAVVRMHVSSGGSAGGYTSYAPAVSYAVREESYGSAGTSYQVYASGNQTYGSAGSTQFTSMGGRTLTARQPIRNIFRRIFGR